MWSTVESPLFSYREDKHEKANKSIRASIVHCCKRSRPSRLEALLSTPPAFFPAIQNGTLRSFDFPVFCFTWSFVFSCLHIEFTDWAQTPIANRLPFFLSDTRAFFATSSHSGYMGFLYIRTQAPALAQRACSFPVPPLIELYH